MQTNELDIVYTVRVGEQNEELRYSLRSIAENLPHARVWIVGYKPRWVDNVGHIDVRQNWGSKHLNAANNWQQACQNPQISERFVLMNDDFFVMKPIEALQAFHGGSFDSFRQHYETEHPDSSYTEIIKRTSDVMAELQIKNPLHYELHLPMIISKNNYNNIMRIQAVFNDKWLPVFHRSLVGNFFRYQGREIEDVKIYELDETPDPKATFLSTTDKIFKHGKAGVAIRNRFTERCKYEK